MRKFTFESGKLNGGLFNKDDDTLINKNQLSDCQNVIYDLQGFAEKRAPAFTNTDTGALWKTGENAVSQKIFTYTKRDGTQFFIIQSGSKVMKSQDLITWTSLGPTFNANYVMTFITFADMLIMSNGFDNMYYWDGLTTEAVKTGTPQLSESVAAGVVTAGVHLAKVTFEKAGVVYGYDVTSSINITASKQLEVILPISADNADANTRRLWLTKAGGTTYYSATDTTAISDVSDALVFNQTDITLGGYQDYATYIATKTSFSSITPPKARHLEIYQNQLFYAHTTDGPSEIGWSEPLDHLTFYPSNVDAINTDDGEYITGIKFFKAMSQLLVFKPTAVYIEYLRGDTYTHKSIAYQGCTFSGSIQEFYIDDKNGARSSVLWANRDGLWEWDGSSPRKASEPVDTMFSKIKQREFTFSKNTKTTAAEFTASGIADVIPKSASYPNNFMDIGVSNIQIKNVFDFTASGITDDIKAACYVAMQKKLYAVRFNTPNMEMGYYTWDNDTTKWSAFTSVWNIGAIGTGAIHKLIYSTTDDKFYVMFDNGSIGYIARSIAAPYTSIDTSISFDITNISTGNYDMAIAGDKLFYVEHATINSTSYTTIPFYYHTLRFVYLSAFTGTKYYIWTDSISTTIITDPIGGGIPFVENRFFMNFASSEGNMYLVSDGTMLYYTLSKYERIEILVPAGSPVTYVKSRLNNKLNTINAITIQSVHYVIPGNTIIPGQSFPRDTYAIQSTLLFQKELSAWDINSASILLSTTIYKLLSFTLKAITIPGSGGIYGPGVKYNFVGNCDTGGKYKLFHTYFDFFAGAPNPFNTTITTLYHDLLGSMDTEIGYCSAKPLVQYFDLLGKMWEYNVSTKSAPYTLESPTGTTGTRAAAWCYALGNGIPEQVFISHTTATSFANVWRGILGDYTLSGTWLLSGTNSVDTGANSEQLYTFESELVGNGTVNYYLSTTPANTDAPTWNSIATGTPLEKTGTLTLEGNRYVQERVELSFNIGTNLNGSTALAFQTAVISIGAVTANWSNFIGTNITAIESVVFNNFYMLAAVEQDPDPLKPAPVYNNVLYVLDRFKRWAVWRGINAASFTIAKNQLYWIDCTYSVSDYIFSLGNKSDKRLSDMYVITTDNTIGTKAIDAWITTKNYHNFETGFDHSGLKKQVRKMYVTARRAPVSGTYNLEIWDNIEEAKEIDGITDLYSPRYFSVSSDSQGKINGRLDYGLLGKRMRFKFRNSTIDQDLNMIDFVISGWILHGRD